MSNLLNMRNRQMNIKKQGFVLFVILCCLSTNSFGQYSYKQHVKYADKSYENGNYREAMVHYDLANQLGGSLDEGRIFKFAEAAFNTYSLNIAEENYNKLLELDSTENAHIASYKLARI